MIIMLGNRHCRFCAAALPLLEEKGVDFEFHDFSDNLDYMREFLKLRDSHPAEFKDAIEQGKIGIPVFVLEDGTVTMELGDCF